MDRVAAEVAQEVGVLLQHDDVDAGAREQEAEHHAGRPAAGDAALRLDPDHAQNARKVMIVRVSTMPGMRWTFSPTKWPISTSSPT